MSTVSFLFLWGMSLFSEHYVPFLAVFFSYGEYVSVGIAYIEQGENHGTTMVLNGVINSYSGYTIL